MTNEHDRIQDLFDRLRSTEPDQRDAILDNECGDDAELRATLHSMLAAADASADRPHRGERAGDTIDRYTLIEPLGEGGFGTVWAADQSEPVRRRVALKIIKLGMDTEQVITRFEAERQALALMDHPHIAKVLDAGATTTGRPYFVMELVDGVPITEYCDNVGLNATQRLRLFIATCNAVQHAHQKGIIHRDLKPSNVLVTEVDGEPVPRVIDFGIAKATNQRLVEETVFTQAGQFVGTPEYMSPEQAGVVDADVDTRSDVYSLGVLLYELLTGTAPFAPSALRRAGIAEIQRIIREEDPPRPSTRVGVLVQASEARTPAPSADAATVIATPVSPTDVDASDSSLDAIAKRRSTSPRTLARILRGDLDWIVMRALEKDRARRYGTASGFAEDVQRYLDGDPVEAAPPSTAYRVRKFVRRNRAGVLAASLVGATLILGIAGTTWGMISAENQRIIAEENEDLAVFEADRANNEAARANSEADRATAANERAQHELTRALEVKRVIVAMLASIRPEIARTKDTALLRMILDSTADRISQGLTSDPVIEAELRHVIGDVYARIGQFAKAEIHTPTALDLRRQHLGEDHIDTSFSKISLATLYRDTSRPAQAEPLLVEAIAELDRAGSTYDQDRLLTRMVLTDSLRSLARYEDAEQLLHEVINLADDLESLYPEEMPTVRSTARLSLGMMYMRQHQFDEAAEILEGVDTQLTETYGIDHPVTLNALHNIALVRQRQGNLQAAAAMLDRALEGKKRVFGENHQSTFATMMELGSAYRSRGQLPRARQLIFDALDGLRETVGRQHASTLHAETLAGEIHLQAAEYPKAYEMLGPAVEDLRLLKGPDHPDTLRAANSFAWSAIHLNRPDEARPIILRIYELSVAEHGTDDPLTILALESKCALHFSMEDWDEGQEAYIKLIDVRERVEGPNATSTLGSMTNLGQMLVLAERHDQAIPWLEESLDRKRKTLGMRHPWTALAMEWLAQAYLGTGRTDDALPFFEQLIPRWRMETMNPSIDGERLNTLAKVVLIDEIGAYHDPDLARTWANRACAIAVNNDDPALSRFLRTRAEAEHESGDTAAAIESLNKAIDVAADTDPERVDEYRALLKQYESGQKNDDQ